MGLTNQNVSHVAFHYTHILIVIMLVEYFLHEMQLAC